MSLADFDSSCNRVCNTRGLYTSKFMYFKVLYRLACSQNAFSVLLIESRTKEYNPEQTPGPWTKIRDQIVSAEYGY